MKKILSIAVFAIVLALGIHAHAANATTDLSGWAWSSNVGWLSFNSANTGAGSGGSYKVIVATTTANPNIGSFGGYAWSDHVGWVSFNATDVSGCPASESASDSPSQGVATTPGGTICDPRVDLSTGKISGWVRVLSMKAENGGGWLHLSGANHQTVPGLTGTAVSNQGVSYNKVSGSFTGYAYEPSAIGWINFNAVSVPTTATACTVSIVPTTLSPGSGQTISVNWTAPAVHNKDWIGIYESTSPNNVYVPYLWKYVPTGTSGTLSFTDLLSAHPLAQGTYNFRYLENDLYKWCATSEEFRVVPPSTPITGACTATAEGNTVSYPTVLPSITAGTQVTFTATPNNGTDPYMYSWNPNGTGNTIPYSSNSYPFTYGNAGSFNPQVTVTDSSGILSQGIIRCPSVTVTSPNPVPSLSLKIGAAGSTPDKTSLSIKKGASFALGWDNTLSTGDYQCVRQIFDSNSALISWTTWSNDVTTTGNQDLISSSGKPRGTYTFLISCSYKPDRLISPIKSNPVTLRIISSSLQEI